MLGTHRSLHGRENGACKERTHPTRRDQTSRAKMKRGASHEAPRCGSNRIPGLRTRIAELRHRIPATECHVHEANNIEHVGGIAAIGIRCVVRAEHIRIRK